jgi:hypothetical protein
MALSINILLPSGEHIALPCKYRLAIDDDRLPGQLWELVAHCGCVYDGRLLWPCKVHLNARLPRTTYWML